MTDHPAARHTLAVIAAFALTTVCFQQLVATPPAHAAMLTAPLA